MVSLTIPFSSILLFSKTSHCWAPFWALLTRLKWKAWNSLLCFMLCYWKQKEKMFWKCFGLPGKQWSQCLQYSLRIILKWCFFFYEAVKCTGIIQLLKEGITKYTKKQARGRILLFSWAITAAHCQSCHTARKLNWYKLRKCAVAGPVP